MSDAERPTNPLYLERAVAFTSAAFRFVGDYGAWRKSADAAQSRVVLEGLAGAYREQYGREVELFAGSLIIAADFLLALSAEIGYAVDEPSPYLIALTETAERLRSLIDNAAIPMPDEPGGES
jgi:hypothetical protein